jgi:hypothetical protein
MGIENMLLVFHQTFKNGMTHFTILRHVNSFERCSLLPALQLHPVQSCVLFVLEASITRAAEIFVHGSKRLFSLVPVPVLADHVTLKNSTIKSSFLVSCLLTPVKISAYCN